MLFIYHIYILIFNTLYSFVIVYVGILREHNCLYQDMHILSKEYCISVLFIIILTQLGTIIVKRPGTIIWMGHYIRNTLLLLSKSKTQAREDKHYQTHTQDSGRDLSQKQKTNVLDLQISKATKDISVPVAIRRQQIDLSTVLIALDIYSYQFIYFNAMNVHFIRNLTIFYSP